MAGGKWQNEDATVLRSIRVTIQVREGKTTLEIRNGKGLLFPDLVVLRKDAKRQPSDGSLESAIAALQAAVRYLPEALAVYDEADEEVW